MKSKTEEGLIVDETLDAYDTQTTTEKKQKTLHTQLQIVVKELELIVEVAEIQLTREPIDCFCIIITDKILELISTKT